MRKEELLVIFVEYLIVLSYDSLLYLFLYIWERFVNKNKRLNIIYWVKFFFIFLVFG